MDVITSGDSSQFNGDDLVIFKVFFSFPIKPEIPSLKHVWQLS